MNVVQLLDADSGHFFLVLVFMNTSLRCWPDTKLLQ